jgi:hypothetical protein
METDNLGITSDGGWLAIFERLKNHDVAMIRSHTEEVDTMLILVCAPLRSLPALLSVEVQAGLFSAVLTSFVTEAYTQLQPDNTQLSARILLDISRQLENLSSNAPAPASSISLTDFTPASSVVAMNVLWFASLILSLSVALLGFAVKEWLRQYLLWKDVRPIQDALQLRQFRYNFFLRWHVPTIATSLSGLFQLSIILFFSGIVALVVPLDVRVEVIVVLGVAIVLIVGSMGPFFPLLFPDCAYKMRVTWLLYSLFSTCSAWLKSSSSYAFPLRTSPLQARSVFPGDRKPQQLAQHTQHPLSRLREENHEAWVRSDLERCISANATKRSFWLCLSLLGATGREDLSDETLLQCTASLTPTSASPIIRGAEPAAAVLPRTLPDLHVLSSDLSKSLWGCWLAASFHLGLSDISSLPFNASAVHAGYRPATQNALFVRFTGYSTMLTRRLLSTPNWDDSDSEFVDELLVLGPTESRVCFHMFSQALLSYLHESETAYHYKTSSSLIDQDINHLHLNTFCLILSICTRHQYLLPDFWALLIRVLPQSSCFLWPEDVNGALICVQLLAQVQKLSASARRECQLLELFVIRTYACLASFRTNDLILVSDSIRTCISLTTERRQFWSAFDILLRSGAYHRLDNDPALPSELRRAISALLDHVREALQMDIELAARDGLDMSYMQTFSWDILIGLVNAHRTLAPGDLHIALSEGNHMGIVDLKYGLPEDWPVLLPQQDQVHDVRSQDMIPSPFAGPSAQIPSEPELGPIAFPTPSAEGQA